MAKLLLGLLEIVVFIGVTVVAYSGQPRGHPAMSQAEAIALVKEQLPGVPREGTYLFQYTPNTPWTDRVWCDNVYGNPPPFYQHGCSMVITGTMAITEDYERTGWSITFMITWHIAKIFERSLW